tara:strand:- start:558 stop:782 length:225 start_codon:yes stop_codon:yes gene_type:complete
MKNKKEEKKVNELAPETRERLLLFETKLKRLRQEQRISVETVKELDMLISELLIMRSSFVDKLLNWAKQDYLIE